MTILQPIMNDQDNSVADYLNGKATVARHYAGERDRDGWQCDAWQIIFTRAGKAPMICEYFTGLGHRRRARKMPKGDMYRKGGYEWRNWNARYPELPVYPPAAAVLWSMIMEAMGADESFSDWCATYGYDTDSRKALETYLACQEQGEKLRAFFTREEIAALSDILEDY